MSRVFFIADLHLGHEKMAIKRGFKTVEEHDEYIISKWNSVINKKDTVWILGDITMENSKHYHLLSRLQGIKNAVLGNHEMPKDINELLKYVNKISGMFKYKGIFLTHCPIHPMELENRVKYNIHGHIHEHNVLSNKFFKKKDKRYICVSCEQIDYTPKLLEELIK